jgi:hypothetical protein
MAPWRVQASFGDLAALDGVGSMEADACRSVCEASGSADPGERGRGSQRVGGNVGDLILAPDKPADPNGSQYASALATEEHSGLCDAGNFRGELIDVPRGQTCRRVRPAPTTKAHSMSLADVLETRRL